MCIPILKIGKCQISQVGLVLTLGKIIAMLQKGEDPKPFVVEECKKRKICESLFLRVQRCEKALEQMETSGEESCMYPMRDYVTCVEGWVQPKVQKYLIGQVHAYPVLDE